MARTATATNGKKKTPSKPPPLVLETPKDGVRTEYVALSHLEKWPRNPKKHDIPGIKMSILRFGYVAPIALDEKSRRMVAGHGRLESLIEIKAEVEKFAALPKAKQDALRKEGNAPERPKNILEAQGEWYVPVLRGHSFKNEREAEAYLLADNRHVETGGWDDVMLRDILKQFKDDPSIEALGWTAREHELFLKEPQTGDLSKTPEGKLVGFMASEIKQIVLMLADKDYEPTLQRIAQVMEKQKLKSHTEAVLFLLTFYETRARA